MLSIVSTLIAIALLFSSGSGLAAAGEMRPFDRAAFMEAQSAGSSIVVWVHAPWCPICKKQQPIVDRLTTDASFNDVTFFRVDFDSSKEFLRELKVNRQSTFVVFKGKTEQGRSTGETNPEALRALFDRAH